MHVIFMSVDILVRVGPTFGRPHFDSRARVRWPFFLASSGNDSPGKLFARFRTDESIHSVRPECLARSLEFRPACRYASSEFLIVLRVFVSSFACVSSSSLVLVGIQLPRSFQEFP